MLAVIPNVGGGNISVGVTDAFMQAVDKDGDVELVEYPVSVEGVIQSFVERAL